ncbi:hypothetical protein A7E78_10685 [Syntrophotalea acetylenivorans]|uniref:Response regulatory domain-containing protein n=1 Tax=Syntrophotalea acetylenivorans TaxID=1842532 RepID=A0A1L3GQY9_9BACT|nr:response regulator [Syntrophotalea acetylenivorans]APG28270.1 hypothetical protein A7E78_10685 [Syntrophotalea acetylenivorans]
MAGNPKILISSEIIPSLDLDVDFPMREGFDIFIARDGQHAWDLIEKERPDLVFLDLYCGGLAGDACCEMIRQDLTLQATPVILVIDSQRKEDLARCLKVKCTDVIFKPLSNHLLLATARRILGLAYRSFPRVPTRLIVRYGVDSKNLFHAFSVNLSSGGVFIETDEPYAPDQELFLEFSLPNVSQPIICKAFVAWINTPGQPVNPGMPPGMGLQFLSLSLPDLLAVWEHISHDADHKPELKASKNGRPVSN